MAKIETLEKRNFFTVVIETLGDKKNEIVEVKEVAGDYLTATVWTVTRQNGEIATGGTFDGLIAEMENAANSNNLIADLNITGHGDEDGMVFQDGGDSDSLSDSVDIYYDENGRTGIFFNRDFTVDYTPLFNSALTNNATIDLEGCTTADPAQDLSLLLPGRTVEGNLRPVKVFPFFAKRIIIGFSDVQFKNGLKQ